MDKIKIYPSLKVVLHRKNKDAEKRYYLLVERLWALWCPNAVKCDW